MTHEMIRALREYYRRKGITADGFACPHEPECTEVAGDDFVTADEPGIGAEYLARTLPRLAVVLLDPGRMEKGTPTNTRSAPADVEGWHKAQHWYQTHELASWLLSVFEPDLTPSEAAMYFAHLRAVRCCENRPGGGQARSVLYVNCQPYLRKELEIVAPDIIVTQGDDARSSVKKSFDDQEITALEEGGVSYWHLPLGANNKALWFHTYHPGHYRGYWRQKEEDWPVFKTVIRRNFADSC